METHFLPGQNYNCVRCAKGCREQWKIHADPHTEQRIAGSALATRRTVETGAASVFEKHAENGTTVLARHEGACIFLQENNKCGVHATLGVNAKPVGCRQFPFQPVNTPDGLFVGISYYCTAAKRNLGRPMDAHRWDLQELLPLLRLYTAGFEKLKVGTGSDAVMEWAVYRRLEELVREEGDAARAVWALSGLSARINGKVTLQALEQTWAKASPHRLVSDDLMAYQERFAVATLLITLEVPEAGARNGMIESFLSGGEVVLTHSGWSGAALSLDPLISSRPEWLDAEVTRYGVALLFRKFLALHRPLLDNAVVLYLMPRLFHLYAAISASKRGADKMDLEDVESAFDRMELFLTHTTSAGMDRMLGEFARSYAKQIEAAEREV